MAAGQPHRYRTLRPPQAGVNCGDLGGAGGPTRPVWRGCPTMKRSAIGHQLAAAVLRPGVLAVAGGRRALLAVRDGREARPRHAEPLEVVADHVRALLAERDVVL